MDGDSGQRPCLLHWGAVPDAPRRRASPAARSLGRARSLVGVQFGMTSLVWLRRRRRLGGSGGDAGASVGSDAPRL